MQNKSNSLLKNTIALYIRMLFSVCVNIYTSRVVLDVLGVDDYGIYSVVGGVVALLGFINSSMSGSTSRFLSIAIGENNQELMEKTYNAAKHLHIAIALLIFLLGETIGLYLINTYIKIPEARIAAANWVYQLSLLTTIFSIVVVPYNAIIISMERMDVFAKIEIFKILMKLGVVILLGYYTRDRLIMYGLLLLLISIIVFFVYKSYCKKEYSKYRFNWQIDFSIIRPMLVYSGWDLLGWGGLTLSEQGRQIFINRFFGVAMNASSGMAGTASTAIKTFTNNIIMVFRPRIIKYYGANDYGNMQYYLEVGLVGAILLMSFIIVPMYYSLRWILGVWLVEVPPYTFEFCRILLIINSIGVINNVIKIGVHASAKMKVFTLVNFVIYTASIVFTYIAFSTGYDVISTFQIALVLAMVSVFCDMYILKRCVEQINLAKLFLRILSALIICVVGYLLGGVVNERIVEDGFMNFVVLVIINTFIIVLMSLLFYHRDIMTFFKSKKVKF